MATAKNPFALILAEREGFGRVVRCQCGAIHVEAGPLSVSFSPDGYIRFVELIHASALTPGERDELPHAEPGRPRRYQ